MEKEVARDRIMLWLWLLLHGGTMLSQLAHLRPSWPILSGIDLQGREVLVPPSRRPTDQGGVVHRGGVQQLDAQHAERGVLTWRGRRVPTTHAELGTLLLVSFTKRLLAQSTSDQIYLAFHGAAHELGVPKEETEKILKTMLRFKEEHDQWPKGFMP